MSGVHSIPSTNLVWDNMLHKWVQKQCLGRSTIELAVKVSVCWESMQKLKKSSSKNPRFAGKTIAVKGIVDTGCSVLCSGEDMINKLSLSKSDLLRSDVTLRVADTRKLTILGALPVTVSV